MMRSGCMGAAFSQPWRSSDNTGSDEYDSLESDGSSHHENQEPTEKKCIDLLLIGKTGHGKSSTGNSILGIDKFKTGNSVNSVTSEVQEGWSYVYDTIVKVVDGPGLGETRLNKEEAKIDACQKMAQAMTLCPNGFSALLLVFKFGTRFTEEEQHCVDMLKSIFGPNIIKDHCVLIWTNGESFDLEDEDMEFEDWLTEQEGPMKKLIIECSYRCVLFRNKTKDTMAKKLQRDQLSTVIASMKSKGNRYTDDLFQSVQMDRERILVAAKAPEIHENIRRDLELITIGLKKLKANENDFSLQDNALRELDDSVKRSLADVKQSDKGTGELKDIETEILNVATLVQAEKTAHEARKKRQEEERKRQQATQDAFLKQQRDLQIKSNQMESLARKNRIHEEELAMARKLKEVTEKNAAIARKQAEDLKGQLVAQQRQGKPTSADPNKVLLVCQNERQKTNVVIGWNSSMGELMNLYYQMTSTPRNSRRFYFEATPIQEHDTPRKLGLENGDVIDVYEEQVGGRG